MGGEKYLYLKLGNSNCLAEYWLSGSNVLRERAVAVYFWQTKAETIKDVVGKVDRGEITERKAIENLEKEIEPYKNKKEEKLIKPSHFSQLREFFNAKKDNAKFIIFGDKNIYICEPKGEIEDLSEDKCKKYDEEIREFLKNRFPKRWNEFYKAMKIYENEIPQHIPKVVEVEKIETKGVRETPHILATLRCNQYYNRSTCREITDFGAVQAIKYCLKGKIEEPKNAKDLLNFLSPYELETLLFLVLKNRGLFVPAWRGGTLKDIDIIGYNLGEGTIEMPPVTFEQEPKTFQVKKEADEASKNADWTVAINFKGKNDAERVLTAEWLLDQIWTRRGER